MGGCAQPGCKNTLLYKRRKGWYCKFTRDKCVASPRIVDGIMKGSHYVDIGSDRYDETIAKMCPGYNLPEYLAVAVRKFRKDVGTPLSFREEWQRKEKIAELEKLSQQQEEARR